MKAAAFIGRGAMSDPRADEDIGPYIHAGRREESPVYPPRSRGFSETTLYYTHKPRAPSRSRTSPPLRTYVRGGAFLSKMNKM